MGLVDLNTSCLSWQGLHFKADWIPTKPTAGLKNPTTEWLVVMSWLFSILLLRSLINAMSCKSISSYSGVSNTRCIIGLINRTQLFPEPLYQVVELQEMQKSISQRFTHLSTVHASLSGSVQNLGTRSSLSCAFTAILRYHCISSVCLGGQIFATEKSKYKVCFIPSRLFRLQIRLESLYCMLEFPRGATLAGFLLI